MPFRNYHQFDTATVRLMTEAYDAGLLQLGISGTDPMSGAPAAEIAKLADEGERRPAALCSEALKRIKAGVERAAKKESQSLKPTK
jgi:hypothetical protein